MAEMLVGVHTQGDLTNKKEISIINALLMIDKR